jgi:hypothetical protein
MMLTHGDTSVVRRERMRGHFMGGILKQFHHGWNRDADHQPDTRRGLLPLP